MSAQETPPVVSWWRVGGFNDIYEPNPDAGKVGIFLGYFDIDGRSMCALQVFPSGEVLHKLPHELFPAERPKEVGQILPPAGTQLSLF